MSMPSGVVLRPMTEADFTTVANLAHAIWNAHYITIIGKAQIDYMLNGRFTAENLRRYVNATDRWLDLLELDGMPIGYCSYARTLEEMKLEQLYLLPAFHGRGLGTRMLDHVAARALASGCRSLMLTVNKRNEKAISTYRRAGFEIREEVVFDIGNGFVMDDFVMTKPLSGTPR